MRKTKTVIYADILIVINIIINYLLLRASELLSGCEYKTFGMLASCLIGGAFSLFIFVENTAWYLSMLVKFVILLLMVFAVTGKCSIKLFLKNAAAFLFANFVFAGVMLALCTVVLPDKILYRNGVVYFDINILTLTVSAIICYAVLTLLSKFIKSKMPSNCTYDIIITYNDESVTGTALFDSGNRLCDCFGNRPVIIAEKEFLSKISDNDMSKLNGFRLIPFSTISGEGVLPAFVAESVTIRCKQKEYRCEGVLVAVTEKKLMCSALIGMPFMERAKEISTEKEKAI